MKKLVPTIFISMFILLLIELLSFILLNNNDNAKALSYTKVDPLLGWTISEKEANKLGYSMENDCILLSDSNQVCDSTLIIYVSGGSTSDLLFDADNWPILLLNELRDEAICVKIYVAATGGYNSGQEYLKLLRDFDAIRPNIHISYSGANEDEYPSYTSQYETELYLEKILIKTFFLMPNFFKFLQKKNIIANHNIIQNKMYKSHDFWLKNNKLMNTHANTFGYKFFCILQPVKGFSGSLGYEHEAEEKHPHYDDAIKSFKNFYPEAIQSSNEYAFIHNFTNIFENTEEEVFIDDCHLRKQYQQKIATSVFVLINKN